MDLLFDWFTKPINISDVSSSVGGNEITSERSGFYLFKFSIHQDGQEV